MNLKSSSIESFRSICLQFTFSISLSFVLNVITASAQPQAQPTAESSDSFKAEASLLTPPILPHRTLISGDAQWFIAQVNRGLRAAYVASSKAQWDNLTDLTPEHEAVAAARSADMMAYLSAIIPLASRFDDVKTDESTRRQLTLLKRGSTLPAPKDPVAQKRLAELSTSLESMYGKGKTCRMVKDPQDSSKETQECRDLEQLEEVMRSTDDDAELESAWEDWRLIARPMRTLYAEQVDLINQGAREVGFTDVGALWRSQYDMSPEAFEQEMVRLWTQVRPLYEALHCHVRAALNQKYGAQKVPLNQEIPAHLTGNMWAQEWTMLYPLVKPFPKRSSVDVSSALRARNHTPQSLTRLAERFFTSLGLDPLPETFWTRSLFEKPKDREVVCHASAWDVEYNNDLRLKMCIKIDHEDLITLHHELGHHYYFQSYYTLPILLQEGANDGFHEGIGDTLALSVTPSYLHKVGILPEASEHPEAVLNEQMRMGLEKLSFLPFGLLVDMWRWRVFKGDVPPEKYTELWWSLRSEYQGIRPPHARHPDDFDPGAKYHVPGNTPYMRYFIAHILQFQFHRALCKLAGHTGPLYTCSIYDSKKAGAALKALLSMGASKPWPEALKVVTGEDRLDASAIIDYFAPLKSYLDEQNQGRTCGW